METKMNGNLVVSYFEEDSRFELTDFATKAALEADDNDHLYLTFEVCYPNREIADKLQLPILHANHPDEKYTPYYQNMVQLAVDSLLIQLHLYDTHPDHPEEYAIFTLLKGEIPQKIRDLNLVNLS